LIRLEDHPDQFQLI